MGVEYEYEAQTFQWQDKVPGAVCPECGTRAEATRSYTPDWFLANGIIIESKGRFTANDRKIALAMRDQGIVIHYLFALNNKLSPKSKTRYTDWCESKGLPCAIGMPPDEWLVEE